MANFIPLPRGPPPPPPPPGVSSAAANGTATTAGRPDPRPDPYDFNYNYDMMNYRQSMGYYQPPQWRQPYYPPPPSMGMYQPYGYPFPGQQQQLDDDQSTFVDDAQDMAELLVNKFMAGAADVASLSGRTPSKKRKLHDLSDGSEEDNDASPSTKEDADWGLDGLKGGKMLEAISGRKHEVDARTPASSKMIKPMAKVINSYFAEKKYSVELEKITKNFPLIHEATGRHVPEIDSELDMPGVLPQQAKALDTTIKNIQKGCFAAISAIAPLAELALTRGEDDQDLDAKGNDALQGLKALSLISLGLSVRRKEQLRPLLSEDFKRSMMNAGEDGAGKFLFGGNLDVQTKKLETAKKVAEKIVKKTKSFLDQQGMQRQGLPQKNNPQNKFGKSPGKVPFYQTKKGQQQQAQNAFYQNQLKGGNQTPQKQGQGQQKQQQQTQQQQKQTTQKPQQK